MKINCIQHVSFEGPANIENWAIARKHDLVTTRVFHSEPFPTLASFDLLIILGGPMSANDDGSLAWMRDEKKLIADAISANKKVLGICLGAQLIASVLGASVYRNKYKEIGWFPVEATNAEQSSITLPSNFVPFHWHGETFDLPRGAVHLATSNACENQAFSIGRHVVGLQFHLEANLGSVRSLIKHAAEDLLDGPFVQQPKEMMSASENFATIGSVLFETLDTFVEST